MRNKMAPLTVEYLQLRICPNLRHQCASAIHQARWVLSFSMTLTFFIHLDTCILSWKYATENWVSL